jgi:hypothetical protein
VLDAGGKEFFHILVRFALWAGRIVFVVGRKDFLEAQSAFGAFEFEDRHGFFLSC